MNGSSHVEKWNRFLAFKIKKNDARMNYFLLLLVLSLALSLNVLSFEYDIDSDGDVLEEWSSSSSAMASSVDAVPDDRAERAVIILNSFPDRSIELYWEDPNSDDEFKMFEIVANGTANLNTFNGHKFYAKEEGMDERLPDAINIRQNIDFYSIGPEETKTYRFSVLDGLTPQFGRHEYIDDERKPRTVVSDSGISVQGSPLRIIGQRTTAMAAKFRCHCKAVDYYYDDGAEGSFQGSLTMGKETTINTYEGHVFFFTLKDKKSVEVARYLMDKDQVTFYASTR